MTIASISEIGMRNKNLVFTSAGKNCNIEQWLNGTSFDIFVTYYGDEKFKNEHQVKYTQYRKGGKFQNLHFIYTNFKEILQNYEAIMVMDDDIEISGKDIDKLFSLRKELNITILQPSFSHSGKISHSITGMNPFTFLRYTNFVEVTCPLFNSSYLFSFLEKFDPRANGGGVDFWFCNDTKHIENSIAIIDQIFCRNPWDHKKGGQREIDLFQSRAERNRNWAAVVKDNKIDLGDTTFKTYRKIYHFSFDQIFIYLNQYIDKFISKFKRKF